MCLFKKLKIQFEMIEKSLQKIPFLTLQYWHWQIVRVTTFISLMVLCFSKWCFRGEKMVNFVNSPPKKCFVFLIYSICFLNGCCFCWILCWHILQCTLGMFLHINSGKYFPKKMLACFLHMYELILLGGLIICYWVHGRSRKETCYTRRTPLAVQL